MLTLRPAVLFSLLMTATSNTFAADFPKAPPNQKDAEAEGLQRANLKELKKFIPGIVDLQGVNGHHKITYKPDGSFDATGFVLKDSTGKWHFDEKNNAYCRTVYENKRSNVDSCFAVFHAPDGTNFFDYDIKDGFYTHVWHSATGE